MTEHHEAAKASPAKPRAPRKAKPKKSYSKTAILFAVSVVLGLANLLLFVRLGIGLR